MKKERVKIIFAWIILVILIIFSLMLTYLKFFPKTNNNIEERTINESSSSAIHTSLRDITENFNKNSKLEEYAKEDITLISSVNNYSIFVSYITDTTTTYEFTYSDLCLSIIINDSEEEKMKFNIVYDILIRAVQERMNNNDDIGNIISEFLNNDVSYDGLTKMKVENGIKYQIDITKKIK